MSVVQILIKLADTCFLFCELGRGSGKTTHILAPRLDRVQNSMPGAVIVLAASAYRDIFDNILPGIMEYFRENYEQGIYFEIGKEPPKHFKPCHTYIANWKHTISFCNGCVVQFVSCDRPESMLGKNAAHLLVDEMLRIPEEKFIERIIPALRSDRSKFGQSPYFMGISGFSSTPNFETDEDWFIAYEKDMDKDLIQKIQEIAYNVDLRMQELESARKSLDFEKINKHEKFIERWEERLRFLRRNQTFYIRASSFSNMKILGIDYIKKQIKNIKDLDKLYTSIFAIRNPAVVDMVRNIESIRRRRTSKNAVTGFIDGGMHESALSTGNNSSTASVAVFSAEDSIIRLNKKPLMIEEQFVKLYKYESLLKYYNICKRDASQWTFYRGWSTRVFEE